MPTFETESRDLKLRDLRAYNKNPNSSQGCI